MYLKQYSVDGDAPLNGLVVARVVSVELLQEEDSDEIVDADAAFAFASFCSHVLSFCLFLFHKKSKIIKISFTKLST